MQLALGFVMPESSRVPLPHVNETKEVEPDYFGYYIHEIQELLSLNRDYLSPLCTENCVSPRPEKTFAKLKVDGFHDHLQSSQEAVSITVSSSLFSNSIGDKLSDLEKERLKASLKQSAIVLSREVDEMLDPVLAMYRLKACLRDKEHLTNTSNVSDFNAGQSRSKKQRIMSPLSSASMPAHAEALASQYFGELNEDLRILLECGESQAKEAIKKYSDELSAKLDLMEKQLEELLDIVMSVCRQMTLTEKQELRKLIQDLPPKNLDRVVGIISRKKLPDEHSCDEMHIDLDKEDNVTLWRLYFYTEAVASAKRFTSSAKQLASSIRQ